MLPESALTSMNVLFATPCYISNVMMNYVVSIYDLTRGIQVVATGFFGINTNGASATAMGANATAMGETAVAMGNWVARSG